MVFMRPSSINLTPRLLSREEAAHYCGVCATTFTARVFPHVAAVRIGSRLLWDMRALDQWIDTLAGGAALPLQTDWLARLDEDDRADKGR
jgi:hypothetical protein